MTLNTSCTRCSVFKTFTNRPQCFYSLRFPTKLCLSPFYTTIFLSLTKLLGLLDGPGGRIPVRASLSAPVRALSGAHQLSCEHRVSFLGLKRPGCEFTCVPRRSTSERRYCKHFDISTVGEKKYFEINDRLF